MVASILPMIFILASAFSDSPQENKQPTLNEEFDVKIGASLKIENERLKIGFSEVAEDSRCPRGVACVWAGNGKVLLLISHRGRTPGKINLNTMLDPKEATYEGFNIKLVRLDPYPEHGVRLDKSQYVSRLIVSKAASRANQQDGSAIP